jgi:hypothetical protein
MTAKELIQTLNHVPEDATLLKNRVGNLAVYLNGDYIGYVDLRTFEYVEV